MTERFARVEKESLKKLLTKVREATMYSVDDGEGFIRRICPLCGQSAVNYTFFGDEIEHEESCAYVIAGKIIEQLSSDEDLAGGTLYIPDSPMSGEKWASPDINPLDTPACGGHGGGIY